MRLKQIQYKFMESMKTGFDDTELLECIKPSSLNKSELMDIYRNSYKWELIYNLKDLYIATYKLIGEKSFYEIAELYVQKNLPSVNDFLNFYGESFSDFIKEKVNLVATPYLPDVAKLEWLIRCSYTSQHKKQKKNILEELSKVPEEKQEDVVFEIMPQGFLLSSEYPVDKIWRWVEIGDVEKVNLNEGYYNLFILHLNKKLQFHKVTEQEYIALESIKKGKNLGELCDILADSVNIIEMLPKFIKLKYIVDFKVGSMC